MISKRFEGRLCIRPGCTPMVFTANKYRFVYGQEPHTNSKKIFPLELRAKTKPFTQLLLRELLMFLKFMVKHSHGAGWSHFQIVKIERHTNKQTLKQSNACFLWGLTTKDLPIDNTHSSFEKFFLFL